MCQQCDDPKPFPNPGLSRRHLLLLAGAGLGLVACRRDASQTASTPATSAATRPKRPPAPDLGMEMFPDPSGKPIASPGDAPVVMLPRTAWTKDKPNLAEINLMGQIERITVHHTGMKNDYSIKKDGAATAYKLTITDIAGIREFHTTDKDRMWADIAYHYIVDPAGRVWQGRPLVYQGSHAMLNNEHNMGIVVMGDFTSHPPVAVQLDSLAAFIGFARALYKVPVAKVYTHGELKATDCPGRFMQAYMNRARAEWAKQPART